MEMSGPVHRMVVRSFVVFLLVLMTGCTVLAPAPPEPVETVEPEPEPIPEPVIEPQPEPPPPPPPVIEPEPTTSAIPQNIEPLIAIVISDRTPAYVEVADALGQFLNHHDVYDLSDLSLSPPAAFAEITKSGAVAVVAVGLHAAESAGRFATLPVVVGQVFNFNTGDLTTREMKAVAVLPPMGLQIDAWQEIDPTLSNVGAIFGPGHEDLIAETEKAMTERGVKFHYAIAQSDRETLYLFNRLVRDLDGFILFPDNRILSRTVLSEMMDYTSRHQLQLAVFNDPLLDHGAAFSSAAVTSDIAVTITRILDSIIGGDIDEIPTFSGLSEIRIRKNPAVLRKLGLASDNGETRSALADNQ